MTARALSAWFALGCALLAMLVAVDRPQWFGLSTPSAARGDAPLSEVAPSPDRTAPWLIKRAALTPR